MLSGGLHALLLTAAACSPQRHWDEISQTLLRDPKVCMWCVTLLSFNFTSMCACMCVHCVCIRARVCAHNFVTMNDYLVCT